MSLYNVDTPDFIIFHLIEIVVDDKLKIGKLPKPIASLITLKENKTNFNNNMLPLTLSNKTYRMLHQDQVRINYLTD